MSEEEWEWNEYVDVVVTVHVTAKPNPDFYEGLLGRQASDLAQAAVYTGRHDPGDIDGFADLDGDVYITDVGLL